MSARLCALAGLFFALLALPTLASAQPPEEEPPPARSLQLEEGMRTREGRTLPRLMPETLRPRLDPSAGMPLDLPSVRALADEPPVQAEAEIGEEADALALEEPSEGLGEDADLERETEAWLEDPAAEDSTAEAEEPAEATAPAAQVDDHAGHEEHHVDSMLVIATFVNFAIWIGILVLIFRKPLRAFLLSRREGVEKGLEESAQIKAAAEKEHAEHTDRLAHLDEELAKMRAEMIQAGEAERDRLLAEAEVRATRMRKDAEFLISQQIKQLRLDLTQEAIEAAIMAAEEVLSQQAGAADQTRLADAYLEDIEKNAAEVRA